MSDIILKTENLGISFGGLKAVSEVNLEIKKKQLYGLVGPNGAGKTTIFNILTGVYKPTTGKVFLDGEEITGKSQMVINHKGIARTFQNIRLFNNMTVIRNVLVGLHDQPEFKCSILESILRLPRHFKVEKAMRERAKEILRIVGLEEERNFLSCNLPYGKQRKLEIARALATNPKLLLLDEPAAGMNPHETEDLMSIVRRIRDEFDMTVLLIEHDMKFVSGLCDEVTVLNFGTVLAQGTAEEALNDPEVIRAKDLQVYYGVIQALKGISFEVNEGEIVTLIGANGAGKTTTMQSIIGLIPTRGGSVIFDGQDITKTPCHKIVHLGMAQVPEGRRIFQELTVYENLLMGGFSQKDKAQIKADIEKIYERFPRLSERRNQIAGTLSGGEQQMLAMGRAMMSHPKLLLLDEPSMGLSPLLVDQVFELIKDFRDDGTTVLLVEQNAGKSLAISDRAYVLELGEIVLSGTGAELAASEEVKKAYLGG